MGARTAGELFAERARLLLKIISVTRAATHQNEFSSALYAVLCVLRVPLSSGRRAREEAQRPQSVSYHHEVASADVVIP